MDDVILYNDAFVKIEPINDNEYQYADNLNNNFFKLPNDKAIELINIFLSSDLEGFKMARELASKTYGVAWKEFNFNMEDSAK